MKKVKHLVIIMVLLVSVFLCFSCGGKNGTVHFVVDEDETISKIFVKPTRYYGELKEYSVNLTNGGSKNISLSPDTYTFAVKKNGDSYYYGTTLEIKPEQVVEVKSSKLAYGYYILTTK